MYSAFIQDQIRDEPVQHLKVNIHLIKNGAFKRVDLASISYPTWFVAITKHGIESHAMPWYPEDAKFRMLRWKCITEAIGFRGLVEVYPP